MFPTFAIERNSDTPVYRQIIEKITTFIKNGALQPGDKIPPERDLAGQLGIARGTIKKAYEELERSNIIEVSQGRGSFVSFKQDVVESGRKERAIRLIEELLKELEKLRFSYREISNLVDLKILEREEKAEHFFIAAVDCNPESLEIYQKQLAYISRIKLKKILLDELSGDPDPEKRLREFGLVFTTATHYSELLGIAPNLREKILQVVVSPSQESIIKLALLKANQTIGVVSESQRFQQIIRIKLRDFGIPASAVAQLLLTPEADVEAFLKTRDAVIVPPGYTFAIGRDNNAAIQAFTERGGRIIVFDYQIERGSLLHLEERIKEILEGSA